MASLRHCPKTGRMCDYGYRRCGPPCGLAESGAASEESPWPAGKFSVYDPDPADDHGPIYLVCPGGLMVNFSNDITPGLDAKRVEWIAATLNASAPFSFDRYVNGELMAEGVRINLASTLEEAIPKALKLCAQDRRVVLVYRPDRAALAHFRGGVSG